MNRSTWRLSLVATGLTLAANFPLLSYAAEPVLSAFEPCTPQGVPAPLGGRAECATLIVPESRKSPQSRTLSLPIVKFRALDPEPAEPVFVLNGGPGEPNLQFTPLVEVGRKHDVYYLGYRGADGSTVLQCPEITATFDAPKILTSAHARQIEDATAACARRLQSSGLNLARYTIDDVIDDLETTRSALGHERINLFSISYGTRVAQYYARRHPQSIFRSIMAGTNPPGHFVFDARANDQILARLSQLCAADADCAAKTPNLQQTMLNAMHAGEKPGNDRVDDARSQLALFVSMYSRDRFISFVDAAVAAERGDTSGLEQAGKAVAQMVHAFVWGDLMSKGSLDSHGYAAKQATFATTTVSMGSPLDRLYQSLTRQWPAVPMPPEYRHAVEDRTQTLVMNGDLDVATPAVFVQAELMPHLPNGKLLLLKDYGHGDFKRQAPAIDRIMATYYAAGELDVSPLRPDPYVFQH